MKKIHLVDLSDIIIQSTLESNVDLKVLSKALLTAQEQYFKPVLGQDLYNDFMAAVEADILSGQTLSDVYASLLDVAKPYLIAKTVEVFLYLNQYKITNKGVLKLSDDQASNLSTDELASVQNYYRNLVDTHKKTILDFLKDNGLAITGTDKSADGFWLGDIWICDVSTPSEVPVLSLDDVQLDDSLPISYDRLRLLNNVLLVSVDEVIAQSNIEANVDTKLLNNTIRTVQDNDVKDLLSGSIYNELRNGIYQVETSGATLNAVYSDLLGLVKPYLINKTVAAFVMANHYKVTNKGILALNDTASSNIGIAEVKAVEKHYINIAEGYRKQIIAFLDKYGLGDCSRNRSLTIGLDAFLDDFVPSTPTESITLSSLASTNGGVEIISGTYSNGVLSLTNSTGGTVSVSGFFTGSTDTDVNVIITGGTYSDGTITLTNSTGGTVTINGLSTGYTLTAPAITSVLGYTPLSSSTDTSIYTTDGTIQSSTRTIKLSDVLSFSGTADAKVGIIGSLGVGQSATTTGQYSFSTGYQNDSFGKFSFASGYQTLAKHTASASFGRGTISTTNEQLVIGKFNSTGNTAAQYLLIGCGTGDTARNDLAWFSISGLTLGDTNTSVNEGDSYAINFQGHGTAGVSQSASIFLDGGGGSSSTAGLKISSSGFIQLIPSNPEVLISGTNPLVYTLSGFRLLANSTTAGITIGNGYPQTTGDLFTIVNSATNSLFTVAAATGNVLIGASSTADTSTALVNMISTSKGLLIPRLTTTQRDAISTPASQLLISNTTRKTLDQYNGTSWNSIAGDYSRDLLAIQLLGSPIKAGPLVWFLPSSGAGLVSTRTYFNAIYVEKEITISGAAFMQTVQGVYTGNNYNGIGLYSYSNGVVTLIDSTANDTEFWKTSTTTTGTWVQKAFSGGTRTLQPGIYFLCALYSSSAQTTAPSIGASSWTANNAFAPLTTNSSRLYGGVITLVTALPATQSCSAWNNVSFYFGLYLY